MLYIIATPIGNLKDITLRALEQLKAVDYILCEDTRTSGKLLKHYEISKTLYSYHKFNEKQQLDKIINDLKQDKEIALISDAGMPAISDPGKILIDEIIKNNLELTVLPGATAFVNAFLLSGFSTPFTFVGFLPNKNKDKRELLKEYKNYKSTLIFYSSPHNLSGDMEDLFLLLGDRKVAVVREITKLYEEVTFTTLKDGYNGTVKGEFVLVVEGMVNEESPLNMLTIKEHLEFYINIGYTKSDAIKLVSADRKISKNEVYKEATLIPVK